MTRLERIPIGEQEIQGVLTLRMALKREGIPDYVVEVISALRSHAEDIEKRVSRLERALQAAIASGKQGKAKTSRGIRTAGTKNGNVRPRPLGGNVCA